jgi:hypothetical protein
MAEFQNVIAPLEQLSKQWVSGIENISMGLKIGHYQRFVQLLEIGLS